MATLTVYPDAGSPGSTSVDGFVQRVSGNSTWSGIRTGAGTSAVISLSSTYARFQGDTVSNRWLHLRRTILVFDTSALTTDASISAAVLSIYLLSKTDPDSNTPTSDIYTASPASATTLVSADYGRCGTTSQTGAAKTYAAHTASAYNDFTLDAGGISNISKTSASMFAWREATYDVGGATPTWSSGADTGFLASSADETGTSQDPKLVITYTNAFTSSLSGAVTPTGSIVKAISQALAGSLTPAGVLTNTFLLFQSIAGALTPAGALTLGSNVAKAVSGAITATSNLILSIATGPYNFGAFRDRRGKRWPHYPIGGPGPGRRRR